MFGDDVALIDPAVVQAERAAELLGVAAKGAGRTTYVTSGDEAAFQANVRVSPFARRVARDRKKCDDVPGVADADKNEQDDAARDREIALCRASRT